MYMYNINLFLQTIRKQLQNILKEGGEQRTYK